MFDQAKAEQVLEHVAQGKSLRQVRELVDVAPSTVCEWAATHPPFAEQYSRAMENRADWHADRIEELAQQVEEGKIAPEAARVAIAARQWTAAKLRPKRYGDRVQHDVDAKLQVTIADPTRNVRAQLVQSVPTLLPKPDTDE